MLKKHLINPALIYDKNSQQTRNRGNIPQHNKGHIRETYCHYHTQWAKTKSFPLKIRNKTRMSTFTILIQHGTGNSSHSGQTRKINKRLVNWEGESKTLIVCRWHDSVHRKPHSLHQKTTWPDKNLPKQWDTKSILKNWWHFCKITMNYQKEKLGKNPIYHSKRKNKVSRNKFNQEGERPILGKL